MQSNPDNIKNYLNENTSIVLDLKKYMKSESEYKDIFIERTQAIDKINYISDLLTDINKFIIESQNSSMDSNKKYIKEELKVSNENSREDSIINENTTNEFLNLIYSDSFESGHVPLAEHFVLRLLRESKTQTKEWLQRLLLNNFNNFKVLVGLLHIISHIDYDEINPEGQIMALACLSNESIEVQDYAIKAFENWGSKDALIYLKNVKCSEEWLQSYLEEVIADLEEG